MGDQNANPLQLVSEALQRRDSRRAAEIAGAALAAGARHPLLFTARAMGLSDAGRHAEALKDFRTAESMGPPNPALKAAIALCLLRMDRPAEAASEYDAVLKLTPNAAPMHCRKGWACELAGDLESARRSHERAVALDPNFAEALARLAYLSARRGAAAEARSYAERALAKDPRQLPARLALAMAALDAGALDKAEEHLLMVLNAANAGPTDRYIAAGLMGDVRDRQDRRGDAFAFYEQANETARKQVRQPAGVRPMLETVGLLRRHFEAMPPRSRLAAGAAAKHVFVLGFLRSGTTLVEEVLAARDDTVVLDEKDALIDAADAFMTDIAGLDRLWAADQATLEQYRARYWQRVAGFGIAPDGKVVIDKMPFATVRIPLITRLFPDAAIVFVVRHPRDVVFSCFRQRFVLNAATFELLSLDGAARLYDETMRLAELYRAKLSPKLFELRLEDLIEDFDGRARALCDFAGLPWQESMRDFAARAAGRAITTPSAAQIVKGLNRRGIGAWQRYAEQLAPVLPLLEPWAARFGYATEKAS